MRDPDELVKALESILEGSDYYSTPEVARGPASDDWLEFREKLRAANEALIRYREAKEVEYRILKRGEIVRIGDQFKDSIEDTWHPVALDVGLKVGTKECPKGIHRRPIRKEQP